MAQAIEFTLSRKPPSVNQLYANRRSGKGRGRFMTKRYKDWRFNAQLEVQEQNPTKILKGDVAATYTFGPRNRRADVENLIKATSDLVVTCGLLTDDSQIVRVTAQWGPNDGCEVEIDLV